MKFQKLTFLLMGILGLGLLPFVSGALMAQTPGFYYTIQKGDTLWDLSQKFNETQWDWPGLWEMNSKVKEPSWIHPGNKIQIFLKNDHSMSMQKVANQLPISPTFAYPLMKYVGFIQKETIPHMGKVVESQKNQEIISVGDTL